MLVWTSQPTYPTAKDFVHFFLEKLSQGSRLTKQLNIKGRLEALVCELCGWKKGKKKTRQSLNGPVVHLNSDIQGAA